MKIHVEVKFEGRVTVDVPSGLSDEQQLKLAEYMALSQVAATLDDPDTPDEAALDELAGELGLDDTDAEIMWDQSTVEGLAGGWNAGQCFDHFGDPVDALELERRAAFRQTPEYKQYIRDMFGPDDDDEGDQDQ